MPYSRVLVPLLSSLLLTTTTFAVYVEDSHARVVTEHPPHVRGELLVRVDPHHSIEALNRVERSIGVKSLHTFSLVPGLRLYQFDPSRDVDEVIRSFKEDRSVVYAEPNFLYQTAQTDGASVNDPEFARLWGLENKGQTGGKADADINAELMWTHQKGSKQVVIGIIDTGIDYTHPDLIDNLWVNANEIKGNGIDDDHNGYIDDIHGINTIKNTGNPLDDNVHGTHVAGTIGAAGNNSLGVVGVAQSVQIVACKFLSSGGSGSTSDAIKCMEYFVGLRSRENNPVNLVATNNSWGGGGSSQALLDAIKAHDRLGILFFAAAGNESNDNDVNDSYPANYDVPNVVSVAATDHNDRLATFSNYGKRKVHVAAPGVKILSTILGHKYGELSGTSMATPHVTGLAAVIASHYRDLDYRGIKNLVITGGQRIDATANTTISGRRIRGADVGGVGSLTCSNQALVVRKAPTATTHRVEIGKQVFLSANHLNCATEGGPLTVYQGNLGTVTLEDNGLNGDALANDGIYSLNWKPSAVGEYQLKFSNSDVVSVSVYDKTSFNPYVANDVPYEYVSINGRRLRADDETMHQLKAPFPIQFGGADNSFEDLYISSNGTISFTDRTQPGFLNREMPTTVANTLLAPYWDDLKPGATDGDIYYETTGTSPSRKFIIEWWKVTHYRTTGLGTFQVVFYESSPDFSFNYLDTNFSNTTYNSGASATVGAQTSQDSGLEYSYNTPNVGSGTSIFFTLQ